MPSHDRFNVLALAEEVLRNPNPGTRKIALQGLRIHMGHERIYELVSYISRRDTNAEVRETALKLLADMPARTSDVQ